MLRWVMDLLMVPIDFQLLSQTIAMRTVYIHLVLFFLSSFFLSCVHDFHSSSSQLIIPCGYTRLNPPPIHCACLIILFSITAAPIHSAPFPRIRPPS